MTCHHKQLTLGEVKARSGCLQELILLLKHRKQLIVELLRHNSHSSQESTPIDEINICSQCCLLFLV